MVAAITGSRENVVAERAARRGAHAAPEAGGAATTPADAELREEDR